MSLRDPLSAVVIFAVSAAFFFIAGNYSGGAEIFPRGVAAIMMICSVILFVRGLRSSAEGERMSRDAVLRVTAVIVLTGIYIVAVQFVGFITSSLIFVPLTSYFLGVRNYVLIGVTTIVFVGLVSFLFLKVFQVPLPPELISTLI